MARGWFQSKASRGGTVPSMATLVRRARVASIAFAKLESDQLFDDLGGPQMTLGPMGKQGEDGLAGRTDSDPSEGLDDIFSHRSLRDRAG